MLIENINILKKTYPHIGNQLKSLKNSLNKELVKLEEGRNGQKTIYVEKDKKKIYFNSKYNPLREAEVIIEEYKTITDDTIVVFYGLGLGYHIDLFLQKHPNVNYYIYETVPEIFYQYISNKSLNQLKNYKLKNIGLGNDIQEITMFLKDIFKNMEREILLIELPIHKQTFNEEYKIFFNLFQKLLKNRRDSIQPNVNNDYFENDNNKSISKDANYIIKDPYAHILYDVRGIFSKQYKENIFNRMDIVVRYLAIEEYYGKNNYGFGLYEKMQKARGQTVHNIYRFKDLIKSINENGFSEESSILVDQNLQLIDGSHRLACALYFNVKRIPIKIDPKISDIKYSIDWFEYVGFTKNELKIIEDKQKSILEEKGIFFVVTLWPPAQKYFDEIASELSDEYNILSIQDYTFENEHEFNSTIRGQYAVDDIESWKIEKKLQYMKSYNKKIRMLTLDIGDPKFRSKAKNNKPISIKVEEIKKKYRPKYSKKIDNYFYDIIMHIGDNYEHSDHMIKVMKKDIDIIRFLKSIGSYKYVLTKLDVPYMPKDFPQSYPLNKDMDILCDKEDYGEICEKALEFSNQYSDKYEIKVINKGDNFRIRFELHNFLLYQIDISYSIKELNQCFVSKAIQRRIKNNNYYIFDKKDELVIRLNEYIKNPQKTHHYIYIVSNKEYLKGIDLKQIFISNEDIAQLINMINRISDGNLSILGERFDNDGKASVFLDYDQQVVKKQVTDKI